MTNQVQVTCSTHGGEVRYRAVAPTQEQLDEWFEQLERSYPRMGYDTSRGKTQQNAEGLFETTASHWHRC